MKKYRKYPAASLKLPFIKNPSHRESAYGVIKKRTERVGDSIAECFQTIKDNNSIAFLNELSSYMGKEENLHSITLILKLG